MFQLVWNEGDPSSENRPEKIIKANYSTQKQAMDQAEHDLEMGKNIIGIANKDGKFVWTPEKTRELIRVEKSGEAAYPWRLS